MGDTRAKILIVDDADMNRELLAEILSEQYDILEAPDGQEALKLLEKYRTEIAIVLLDIIMPGMDGFGVLERMKKRGWLREIPVVMISAEPPAQYVDRAYSIGAADYINRPFDIDVVQHRVKNNIIQYSRQKQLEKKITQQMMEKERCNYMMTEILSNIVEFRNGESGEHVMNIRVVTRLLLRQLAKMTDEYDMGPDRISMIVNASALHDIGKISIPDEILNKPGKLSQQEFEVIQTHSRAGAQILENTPGWQREELLKVAHEICMCHHERFGGDGYPDRLRGDEIPISAQVVALADVYDALTHTRVYKPAFDHDTAVKMILNGECGTFNPLLLQCFVEVSPMLKEKLRDARHFWNRNKAPEGKVSAGF